MKNKGIIGSLILLLFFNISFLHAQNDKISLSVNKVELKAFLNAVEEKSSYTFIYRDAIVDNKEKVTLTASNESIQQILNRVLPSRNIQYSINGTSIQLSDVVITEDKKKEVKGVITSQDGELLVGVMVKEKNTNNGIITDMNGAFSFQVSENADLEIRYIGFEPQTISTKNKNSFEIALAEDTQVLDEVIVVGYGVQKKVNMTGAISTIKGDDIASKPIVTLKDGLAGMAPGMTVTKSSGQPGKSNPVVRIRGVGTWVNSSPLILVDGMSMSLSDVMANDIESISVLKDAASSAIYGSRAANGVILITTKQGKQGKMQVSYNATMGFQQATRVPKMAKSWQYAELYNQAMANDGQIAPGGTSTTFPADKIARMKAGGNPDLNEGSTDWFDEILKTAPQYTQDLSISGGTDKISYVGTLGWANQEGVIESSYERYNTRLNTSAQVTNWFKLTSNIAYINDISKEAAGGPGGAYYKVPRALPYMPVKYSDGTWSFHSTPVNPIRMTTSDYGYEKYAMDKLSLLVSPEVTLFDKSLVLKGIVGYESKIAYIDTFKKKVKYDAFEDLQTENVFVPRNEKSDNWIRDRNLTLTATANYMKTLGKHDFNLLVGGSREQFKNNSTFASRKDFPSDDFVVINPGDAKTAAATGNKTYHALVSTFGRINYVFDNRYLFEANVRMDGSSKFKKGRQWGTFPSFSAGWRVSEEAFFQPIEPIIQNLKLKASWGRLGNQQIDNYKSMSTYGASGNYIFGDAISNGYSEAIMGNSLITWETSDNLNFGLELNVLRNRLGFSFDWYKRKTKDILLDVQAPAILGMQPPTFNAGIVQNKGWEMTINWQDRVSKDLSYNVGFSLSDVKNKILDMQGFSESMGSLTAKMEGNPITAMYGWETLGIAHNQELVDKYKDAMKAYNSNFGIGDIIIKDQQKPGEDGYGTINADDKKMIGNTLPRYTYDINLGLNYKGFDFMALLQGVGKADGFLGRDVIEPLGPMSALKEHYNDSFNPHNPTAGKWFPRMSMTNRLNYANMSHWKQDASYLRLKTVQLGYTFAFPKSYAIEKLRLTVSGQNLLTFTKHKILDPETGLNSISFPNVAVYSFGVNVVF